MVNISYGTLALAFLSMLFLSMATVGFMIYKKIGWLGNMFDRPTTYKLEGKNPELFLNIIDNIKQISFEEKLQIVTILFGRPTRIHTGCDCDGTRWLESVTFFDFVSDGDKSFHFESTIDKKQLGVG